MKQSGRCLIPLLALLCVPAAAQTRGFIVISSATTRNFVLVPEGRLKLEATGPRLRPGNFTACAGRIFGVEPIPGRLLRLGSDLKEDAAVKLGPVREIAYLLGADDRRVFVFFDNTLEVFDADLRSFGRVTLAAERRGDIVPVISPDGFRVYEDRAFIMASNTGDVFVVGLKDMQFKRLGLDRNGEKGTLRALWIDPEAGTLDVLDERRQEEFVPAGKRVIKGDYTQTFRLADLEAKPARTRLYEEREIHGFQALPPESDERPEHIQYRERGPMHHPEGRPVGTKVGVMSETNPSVARVMEYGQEEGFPGTSMAVLRSAGRLERLDPARKPNVRVGDRRVELLPKEYSLLVELLGANAAEDAVLAY